MNISVEELVRKAYLISRKLKITEFTMWLNFELNGYNDSAKIPPYRFVTGTLKYHNPFYGLSTLVIDDQDIGNLVTTRKLENSISEIEYLFKNSTNVVYLNVAQNMAGLNRFFNSNIIPEKLEISTARLQSILNMVRNSILEWAIKLNEDDISGNGYTFTNIEEEIATNNLEEYSNIIIKNDTENIKNVLITIDNSLSKLELANTDINNIKMDIQSIKAQLDELNPNHEDIANSFQSIRNIIEGASGSLLASFILYIIPNLFYLH